MKKQVNCIVIDYNLDTFRRVKRLDNKVESVRYNFQNEYRVDELSQGNTLCLEY